MKNDEYIEKKYQTSKVLLMLSLILITISLVIGLPLTIEELTPVKNETNTNNDNIDYFPLGNTENCPIIGKIKYNETHCI